MMKEQLPKPTLIEDLGLLYPTENSKKKVRYGLFKCGFCGEEFRTQIFKVKSGHTKSCGCYSIKNRKEVNVTHNLTNTKLYGVWCCIKSRTTNINNTAYPNYGGRGITICDEWKNDFKSFYDWAMANGYEENKGLSIDRIDNDGNYEPSNCRWTTQIIQSRNTRVYKNNSSGYKGVSYTKKVGKYQVQIKVNKNKIYLGLYLDIIEGAIAYNNYIIENNLEGFILNEIPNKSLTDE